MPKATKFDFSKLRFLVFSSTGRIVGGSHDCKEDSSLKMLLISGLPLRCVLVYIIYGPSRGLPKYSCQQFAHTKLLRPQSRELDLYGLEGLILAQMTAYHGLDCIWEKLCVNSRYNFKSIKLSCILISERECSESQVPYVEVP